METINFESLNSLPEALSWSLARYGSQPVFLQALPSKDKNATTEWRSSTRIEFFDDTNRVAHYLERVGVKKGSKVAIIGNTRPEWLVADFAILSLGAITVSIYQSLPANEVGYILHDSGAEIVFIENEEQLTKIRKLLSGPCSVPDREGVPAHEVKTKLKAIIAIEQTTGHELLIPLETILADESLPNTPPLTVASIHRSDIASIVYTSGTTGPPKGVLQTHGNHLSNIRQATESGIFGDHSGKLFLYLPLAHSFARLVAYIGIFTANGLCLPSVIDTKSSKIDLFSVAREIRESDTVVLPSVPRLFEKMMSTLQGMASRRGPAGMLLTYVFEHALIVQKARAESRVPPTYSSLVRLLATPLLSSIRGKLVGKSFGHAVSGGAKLPMNVNLFFDSIGIPILEGYGLTETCVATNVNLIDAKRYGSVGPAFKDVEVEIAPDGEILYRGPNVAVGYYNRPQATAEAWDKDGWFHTGDIGRVDEDGFLFITDRKKDLIVTAGGKKIAPQMIEDRIKASPYISHAVLCGELKPFCIALVTLEYGNIKNELRNRGITPPEDFVTAPEVSALIKEEIDAVNSELASFESIKKFHIMPGDFTIENGLLTPSLKVKRREVQKQFGELIESLFSKSPAHG